MTTEDREVWKVFGVCSGFTLVELLVTFALLGMIAVGVAGALHLGAQAWHKNQGQIEAIDDVAVTQRYLRRQLEQAYPYYATDIGNAAPYPLVGTVDELTFSSNAPSQFGGQGLLRMSIYVENRAAGRNLVLSTDLDRSGATDPRQSQTSRKTVLLRDVRDVRFSYFDRFSGDGGGTWRTAWRDSATLPSLIRIEIGFAENDVRAWPALVIRLMIDMDANCTYDPISRNCRGR